MVLITKDEKIAIREKFQKVGIVRTMRQKSKRHRYYLEEAPQVMRYLSDLRNKDVTERHIVNARRQRKDGKDVRHATGTKRK